MPYSIQVHHNTPEAFSEADVSDVLNLRLWEDPKLAFQFVKDGSMNEDANVHIAYYSSYET